MPVPTDGTRAPADPGAAICPHGVQDGCMRLVSLLPSATEIVYALGLGDDLVGVTFECDEPPSARVDKTVVVGGRDTGGMTPGEIDDYVKAQMAAGTDLYTLHADALQAGLRPGDTSCTCLVGGTCSHDTLNRFGVR